MLKRFFDIFFSIGCLVLFAPVVILVACLVYFKLGPPILFRQKRPGLHGVSFEIIKFKTMIDAADNNGKILPDEQRLTKFGKWLRSTSLDELPEFWNILKGDMSIVGPRPLLMEYLSLYTDEQSQRHEVKPGLTGWAQVNGRNAITWKEKFNLDLWYVKNRSFWLDIKIIYLTIMKVLKRDGINSANHVTIDRFTGNEK